MAEQALIISGLSGGYIEKDVLHGIEINIPAGSFCAIAGPNGSGKSTLLKYIIRELRSKGSKIEVLSENIEYLKQKEIASLVSFVGQNWSRDYEFTVKELVSMGRFCHEDKNEQAVIDSLEATGISDLKDKLITKISGGEFQLCMLSRAICQDTPVIILDEPSNNLDPYHQIKMMKLLKSLSENGKTIICVMHDLNSIMAWCTDTILLKDGKIKSQGKTADVLTPENIKEVYNVECTLISQEYDLKPLIVYCNR